MARDKSFEELWEAPVEPAVPIDWSRAANLPPLSLNYLHHSLGSAARHFSAARLRMHGEIRLKDWYPFEAEQVMRWQKGFVWRARVHMKGLTIKGFDRYVDGMGEMNWKTLGIIPVMHAEGPDVSRSALGRVQIESIWMPSVLLSQDVSWEQRDSAHLGVNLSMREQATHLDIAVSETGALRSVVMMRWGNPEGHAFHEAPFGGIALAEETFQGVTIPTKLRIGWHPSTDGFERDGEFFRVTVDEVTYR